MAYTEGNDKYLSEVEESKSDSHNASFNHELMNLVLMNLRRKHFNKLIVAHLNINSLRNISEFLVKVVGCTAY